MEQSLPDGDDGEELIDTKVEGVHSTDKDSWPSEKYASSVRYGDWPADYAKKI